MTTHMTPTPDRLDVAHTCHSQTIPRELVHRCSISEVFVTSLWRAQPDIGGDEFRVGAQLPRMHAYFGDHRGPQAGWHDPLLVMETARQAAIAVTHQFFDVPLDSAFLVRTFNGVADAPLADGAWRPGSRPADVDIAVGIGARHVVADRLIGLDMVLAISADGAPLMTVDGSFSWTTRAQWSALRAQARGGAERGRVHVAEPAHPHVVGRFDPRNVVVGVRARDGHETRGELVVDTAHPGLFDHELDHVPGTLLLEAARQIALAHVGTDVRIAVVRSSFGRFVELDRPARCIARTDHACTDHGHDPADPGAAISVLVTIEQGGTACAEVRLGVVIGT